METHGAALEDAVLLHQAADGDLGAVRELYDRHAPRLTARLMRRCNDREVVLDAGHLPGHLTPLVLAMLVDLRSPYPLEAWTSTLRTGWASIAVLGWVGAAWLAFAGRPLRHAQP